MVKLSVNVNKVATLRNSRGGGQPSVLDAVRVVIDAGAPGVTVHPRADARVAQRRDLVHVDGQLDHHASSVCTTSAIAWAQVEISPWSFPSSMMRRRGSVPEYRISRRPSPCSFCSTSRITAATAGTAL